MNLGKEGNSMKILLKGNWLNICDCFYFFAAPATNPSNHSFCCVVGPTVTVFGIGSAGFTTFTLLSTTPFPMNFLQILQASRRASELKLKITIASTLQNAMTK